MKDPVAEVREVSEVSDVHLEMPRHGLRSTQLTPSPDLLPLLERVAINKNVIISVFDFAFLPQFYSFYHSSLLPLHITNFIAFAMDKRTYKVDLSLSFELDITRLGNSVRSPRTGYFHQHFEFLRLRFLCLCNESEHEDARCAPRSPVQLQSAPQRCGRRLL